jgi:hypothetical protein
MDRVSVEGLRGREVDAATILAAILDARIFPRDVRGAPSGTHDFDLMLAGGATIAVEVASLMNGPFRAFLNAKAGTTRPAPSLSGVWVLGFDHHQSVKKLWKIAETRLAELEAAGITEFRIRFRPNEHRAITALRDGGVTMAIWRPGRPGGIGLNDPLVGSFGLADVSEGVAEAIADNRDKLVAADADARHVFVWVEIMHLAGSAMSISDRLPDDCPPLGPVDKVWVARDCFLTGPEPADRLWTYTAAGWEDETALLPS